uniref:Nonstructural protein n=1 Tax=Parvoviridae sp. TaxID=1940570 RepID=A0A7D3UI35_9VIRU|nr:MAG: nonstructural protein [Parvoviridae sp.]
MSEEVEGPGVSYRQLLWMGLQGTSGDIPSGQAEALLIEKDFVLSPEPEMERFIALINMKSWQCGIFQIADHRSEPIANPLPYVLLFNHLVGVHHFVCSGEYNKDGIFHVHALLKTNMRSDSLRRSMVSCFSNLMCMQNYNYLLPSRDCTFDCLKLQMCSKPSSMLAYICKSPDWLVSNDERMLQLGYDMVKYGMHERFLKKQEERERKAEISPDMNKMSEEIIDTIITNGCKSIEDIMRANPEAISKYLHRPGLKSIVENCLQFVKCTGGAWSLSLYEPFDPNPMVIHKILLHQGILPSEFDIAFHSWITKADSKRNCICIQGPSNTGKSAFISGLKQCLSWGEIVNGSSGFNFEGLIEQNIAVWEEPLMGPELAEKFKQIAEGMTTSIPVKYKKPFMLPRIPVIITTNHDIWRFCTQEEPMFRNRMWIFNFNHNAKDEPYTPRAFEYSCECPYCQGSRGRALAHGEPSSGGVQGEDQSVHSGELSIRSSQERDVRSGSLRGGDESAEGSNSGAPSCGAGSSDIECASSSGIHSSTRGSDVRHVGAFRVLRPGGLKRRLTQSREHVESHGNRSSVRSSRGGNARGRRGGGGDGDSEKECDSTDNVVSQSRDYQEKKQMETSAKKRRVGRVLATKMNKIKIPMYVPSKSDWQEYLSFIYHWYG